MVYQQKPAGRRKMGVCALQLVLLECSPLEFTGPNMPWREGGGERKREMGNVNELQPSSQFLQGARHISGAI